MSEDSNYYKCTLCEDGIFPVYCECEVNKMDNEEKVIGKHIISVLLCFPIYSHVIRNTSCTISPLFYYKRVNGFSRYALSPLMCDVHDTENPANYYLMTPMCLSRIEDDKPTMMITPLWCYNSDKDCMLLFYSSKKLCCTPLYWNCKQTESKEIDSWIKERDVVYHYFCCRTPISAWKSVRKIEIPSKPNLSKDLFQTSSSFGRAFQGASFGRAFQGAPEVQKMGVSHPGEMQPAMFHYSPSREEGEEEEL